MGSLCTVVELKKYFVMLLTILCIKYSECLSIFLPELSGMPIAYFLRSVILSSVSCPTVQYFFPHYLINDTIFGRKKKRLLKIKSMFYFIYEVYLKSNLNFHDRIFEKLLNIKFH